MDQFEFEIRMNVCKACGGSPMQIILPGWPYPTVGAACSKCGRSGPRIYFTNEEHDKVFMSPERAMLPCLATARRQASASWNEENHPVLPA